MAKTRLTVVAKTDVGRLRDHNEDSVAVREPKDDEEARAKGYLLLVADGMGGHAAGEVASGIAAETIVEEYYGYDSPNVRESLDHAFRLANQRIHAQGEEGHGQSGMGTTCAVAVIRGGVAYIAHVGDSRIYLVRGGEIRQLTEDHSWVQEQVRAKILDPEEAKTHPMRNIITRALGNAPEVAVEFSTVVLRSSDYFLLCSDGLSGLVEDSQIQWVVLSEPDLGHACEVLIAAANGRGGPDNISVVLARVEEVDQDETVEVEPPPLLVGEDTLPNGHLVDTLPLILDLKKPQPDAEPTTQRAEGIMPAKPAGQKSEKEVGAAAGPTPSSSGPGTRPLLIKSIAEFGPPASAPRVKQSSKSGRSHLNWMAFFGIILAIVLVSLVAGAYFVFRDSEMDLPGATKPKPTIVASGLSSSQTATPLPSSPVAAAPTALASPSPAATVAASMAPPGVKAVPTPTEDDSSSSGAAARYPKRAVSLGEIWIYLEMTETAPRLGPVPRDAPLSVMQFAYGTVVRDTLGTNTTDKGGRWYQVTFGSNRERGWVPSHWVRVEGE